MAVHTGQCEVAVVWRARKRASKTSRPWAQASARMSGLYQWSRPFGLLRPVDEVAMLARRYMHEFGAHPRPPGQRGPGFPQATRT